MTSEAQELKLYEDIKKSFSVKKGEMLMLEWDIADFSQLRIFLTEDLGEIRRKVSRCAIEHRAFAIFDFLNQEKTTYNFRGRTFRKIEILKTGEVLDFHYFGEQKSFSIEDVKKDFEKLKKMLNSKAS